MARGHARLIGIEVRSVQSDAVLGRDISQAKLMRECSGAIRVK